MKGGNGMSGFAMSKFGIRALAQSLAREFGPKGVHVSHAVIDGLIDTDKTKDFLKDVPDAKISPEWVGYTHHLLQCQANDYLDRRIILVPSHSTSRCLYS